MQKSDSKVRNRMIVQSDNHLQAYISLKYKMQSIKQKYKNTKCEIWNTMIVRSDNQLQAYIAGRPFPQ